MNCSKSLWIAWALISLSGGTLAQPGAQSEAYNMEVFTDRQGLSDKRIYAIGQDRQGFLWVGTINGLNRYDGYRFRHFFPQKENPYSLPHETINFLDLAPDGRFWIGTEAGLVRIDTAFMAFFDPLHPLVAEPRDASILQFDFDERGRVWFINRRQRLYLLDPATREIREITLPEPPLQPGALSAGEQIAGAQTIFDVWIDGEELWLGARTGIWRGSLADLQFTFHPIAEAWPYGVQYVRRMKDGSIWVMIYQQGVYCYDVQQQTTRALPMRKGFEYSYLVQEDEEHLLLGSAEGLVRLHTPTEAITRMALPFEQGVATSVTALFKDRGGIVWIGTENGLIKFDPLLQGFRYSALDIEQVNGFANELSDLLHDLEHQQWYALSATQRLLLVVDDQNRIRRQIYLEGLDHPTTLFRDAEGRIWIGHHAGLARYDPASERILPGPSLPVHIPPGEANRVEEIAQSADGRLWIATTYRGCFVYDPVADRITDLSRELGIPSLQLSSLALDRRGRYAWIGSEQNGIWQIDMDQQTVRQFHQIDSVKLNRAGSIVQDLEGGIWISTSAGVVRWESASGQLEIVRDRLNSFPLTGLAGGVLDGQGNIWWGWNDRLVRLEPSSRHFKVYDYRYGTGRTPFGYQRLRLNTERGELYALANTGFLRWRPEELKRNTVPPVVANVSLQVRNSLVYAPLDSVSRVGLRSTDNPFSLEWAALNFTLPEENLYQWKLEGYDQEWSPPGRQRMVQYNYLAPGTYQLQVRAANNDGVWNESPTRIDLTIFPAWWQTWYFRLSLALVATLGGTAWWWFRRRSRREWRQMEDRARELERSQLLNEIALLKTQVNPHFLFNSLSILSSLVRIDPQLSEQFIEQLARSYRYILEQKDQSLVSLRTELEFIKAYAFLLKIRFEHKFDLDIDLPEETLDHARISPLTLQLLVENAVKHNRMSKKEPLIVHISHEGQELLVKNPYRPRSQAGTSTGIGLKNIINRYHLLTERPVWVGKTQDDCFLVRIPLM